MCMKPYTYIAIHKCTGYFYYGVRLANKLNATDDLGKVYFTSSNTVKAIVNAEGADSFLWIVRREFDCANEAALWEYKVIRRLLKHPKILNKAISPINVPGNWYTNGVDNLLGKYCPIGYRPGRTYKETNARLAQYENQKNNRWWNNGITSVFCQVPPNNNWKSGRLKSHISPNFTGKSLTGSKWWNNGEINYRGVVPPPGYSEGRLPVKHNKKHRSRTDIEKIKQSETMSKKRWWNNGVISVFRESAPDGYVKGRLPIKRR